MAVSHGYTSTARPSRVTQGAAPRDKKLGAPEPADHAIGTSRGASMPRRILPRSMSTTVMQMLSPMKIFSPSFRLNTSMSLPSFVRGPSGGTV